MAELCIEPLLTGTHDAALLFFFWLITHHPKEQSWPFCRTEGALQQLCKCLLCLSCTDLSSSPSESCRQCVARPLPLSRRERRKVEYCTRTLCCPATWLWNEGAWSGVTCWGVKVLSRSGLCPHLGHADRVSYLGRILVMIADTGAGIWNWKEKLSQRQKNGDVISFLKNIYVFIYNFWPLSFWWMCLNCWRTQYQTTS